MFAAHEVTPAREIVERERGSGHADRLSVEAPYRIGLIDDSAVNLDLLRHIVGRLDNCEVETFLDPSEAVQACLRMEFDLILTDYMMPGLDGIGVVEALRYGPMPQLVPIVIITTSGERDVRRAALVAGATDFIQKPFDPTELRARLRNLLELSRARKLLKDRASSLAAEVARATREIAEREREIVQRLMRAFGSRDQETGDHVTRVAAFVIAIAEGLGLAADEVSDLALASTMHDVGKLAVPEAVLLKDGPLSEAERAVMMDHTRRGFEILDGSRSRLIRLAAEIALTHHERWDGRGYPRGLSGTDIPLGGRIAAVADVFDALVSGRPYKRAWSPETARAYLEGQAGEHFDPECVRAFCTRWPEIVAYLDQIDVKPSAHAA